MPANAPPLTSSVSSRSDDADGAEEQLEALASATGDDTPLAKAAAPTTVDDIPLAEQAIEVRSVDGYQGREKRVIILSAVRSNDRGAVGFLADYRRLNVALTRAQQGVVVVGDPDTLRFDATWAKWLQFADENQLVVHSLYSGSSIEASASSRLQATIGVSQATAPQASSSSDMPDLSTWRSLGEQWRKDAAQRTEELR